jgi:oligopeptide transport system substrate-binding protein
MRVLKRGHKVAAVAVAGMLLAAGCGGGDDDDGGTAAEGPAGNQTGPITEGGTITVRGCKPARPLIPADTKETCGGNILDAVTAKLVRYDPDTAEAENDIAESITTKDNRTYTIKIKKGIKFHDGTPVTAKSFVDAWNFSANGNNAMQNASFFEVIEGYDKTNPADPDGEEGPKEAPKPSAETLSGLKLVNDTTFTVRLADKNSTFPQRLGYTTFAPLPESFFKDDGKAFGRKPIGAGPFKMQKFDPNVEAVLVTDKDYDRVGKPHIDGVTFKIFTSADPAYEEVVANQLDITDEVPSAKLVTELFKTDTNGRYAQRPEGVIQTFTFPPSKTDPSYDNPKLRQAISMAINREEVIKLAFPDREPATGWVSPVVGGYKANQCGEFCTFNPDRAKQLFDEAGGYNGAMTLSYNADADHKTWTEAVCNQIKNNLDIECIATPSVDFATFRTKIDNREMKGMFRTGWQMDYPSIENFLEPIYKTGASSNDGDDSNPEFDKLLDEAKTKTDEAEVFALYQQAEAMLVNDMPAVPLWYPTRVHVHSDRVTNVKVTAFGTYDFSSITVVNP